MLLPVRAETLPLEPRRTWDMLDYMAADDVAAVQGGRIPTLEVFTRIREVDLAAPFSPAEAHAVVAYLRSRPGPVNLLLERSHPFALARERLAASERAYAAGHTGQATTSALSAFLDGVDAIEPALGTRDPPLMREIETALARYHSQLARPAAGDHWLLSQRPVAESVGTALIALMGCPLSPRRDLPVRHTHHA